MKLERGSERPPDWGQERVKFKGKSKVGSKKNKKRLKVLLKRNRQ